MFFTSLILLSIASNVGASNPNGLTTVCRPEQSIDPVLIPFIRADTDPFCMNNGRCKRNFDSNPDFPCVCYGGATGPHCEFKDASKVPKCSLECFNHGVCQVGIRSYLDMSGLPSSEDYNYCRCPPGFYGDQCEVKGQQCRSTICLNEGQCVRIQQDDGSVTEHCDCTTAKVDGLQYAGRYCQSSATSDCSDHDPINPSNFCVNGGLCRVEPYVALWFVSVKPLSFA